jgi:hypothetical protein
MPRDTDRQVASLFDDDNDLEIAATKSDRSRRGSSSEASRPPTSESEGMFDDMAGDSGKEEVDNDDNFPAHVSTSSRGSKQSKSSQVSSNIYFTNVVLNFFSLSAPLNAMLH